MLELLTQSTWADRVGWVLVHSLWQFALVAVLAVVLQPALKRRSTNIRYGALLAAMCILIAIPIATWFSPWAIDSDVVAVNSHGIGKSAETPPSQDDSLSQHRASKSSEALRAEWSGELAAKRQPELRRLQPVWVGLASSLSLVESVIRPWLPEIVLVWFAGVLAAAMRPVLSWYMVRRLRTTGIAAVGDAARGALERTANRLGLTGAFEVLQSTLVTTPVVIGYLRPVVLLPLCAVTGLSEAQLELILAHELAHIRRHDYLVNLLQTLVETLFFYHPGVWWLSRQIRIERENCCDDVAIATADSRADYGRALLAIEELRGTSSVLSLGAHGGSLLARIRRIAGREPAPRISGGESIAGMVLVAIAIVAAVTWAATPPGEKPSQAAALTRDAVVDTKDQSPALLTAFGKVIDSAGKPVAGAGVYLREWSTSRISSDPYIQNPQDVLATTHTDTDGTFRFEKVPAKPFASDQWFRENPWDIVVVATSYSLAWRHMLAQHPSQAFEIVLQPGAAISGQVTDREARPIKGATVRVFDINPLGEKPRYDYAAPATLDLQDSQLMPSAETDGDGRFEIRGLPRDVLLRVVVTHDNFDREFLHVATTEEPQPDLEATPRRDAEMGKIHPSNFTVKLGPAPPRITGQVVAMDTNHGIAGARIEGVSDSFFSYATADDRGHFVLTYVRGSQCRVRAEGPLGSRYLGRIVLVGIPQRTTEVPAEIKLARGEPLQGVVVAADAGKGVPGVSVRFDTGLDWDHPQDGAMLPIDGKTDTFGSFQILVPPGKGKVVISGPAPGFDLPRNTGQPDDLDPEFTKEVELISGQATPEVKFVLRPEGAPIPPGKGVITGRVIDSAGKPVAGAEVAPNFWLRHPGAGRPVPTDRDGRFWLRLTRPPQEEFIIAIDRQRGLRGHAPLPESSFSPTQKTLLEIRLAPTGAVAGRVMEGDRPVVNAQIQADELEAVEGSAGGSLEVNNRYFAKTDDNGHFIIPLVEAGHRLHLLPHIEGYTNTDLEDVYAVAVEGQTVEVKPFSMIRTDKLISGIVVDTEGQPVSGAEISVEMRSGQYIRGAFTPGPTGKDGRFTIRGVPNVPLTVLAHVAAPPDSQGQRRVLNSAMVEAEPGETDVRIVLDPKLERGKE